MKELIIDKDTNINKIHNKEEYEKLVIKTKVNPNKLKDFINIKEVTIERYKKGYSVYNEEYINDLPFIEGIEKLTFIDIDNYGRSINFSKDYYELEFPNLKNIEIKGGINNISRSYFNSCSSLESITINSDFIENSKELNVCRCNLKEINIIKNNNLYNVKLDYEPTHILLMNKRSDSILEYQDDTTLTKIKTENKIIKQEHLLHNLSEYMIKNKTLHIPDYISYINLRYNYNLKFDNISFNLNLLKTQKDKTYLIGKDNLKKIKKIIIRSNNEMSLFENFEIELNNDLKELYIENNELNIIYKDKVIIIDENGKKTLKELVTKTNNNSEIEELFNKYNLEEIEEYLYYKKLLEILKKYKDDEINTAMNLIGDKIIKKLTK